MSVATTDFKIGEIVLVSTSSFNKIKGCKHLEHSCANPFVIRALHGENAVPVGLHEEISNVNPTFPVSLIKAHKAADSENFHSRNKIPQYIPAFEASGTTNIIRFCKEREVRTEKVRQYLIRYTSATCEDGG
ncbi:hypothetical protein O181_026573 [Austropuccinia psidii MF-1]|uniref:Uncharacterized protein n=1 Tax=Austropuccinia psidii MF-1 TaxID=1389203 RepID=A0A9Q3CMU2_9BASI|nr:hypothetical protein [Austropuccinia psidii MF-1]